MKHFTPDYSFMHLGGIYQAILEVMVEACRRFGAEQSWNVIATAADIARRPEMVIVQAEIFAETGIRVTEDDLLFLDRVVHGWETLSEAEKSLKEACNG